MHSPEDHLVIDGLVYIPVPLNRVRAGDRIAWPDQREVLLVEAVVQENLVATEVTYDSKTNQERISSTSQITTVNTIEFLSLTKQYRGVINIQKLTLRYHLPSRYQHKAINDIVYVSWREHNHKKDSI